MPQLDLFIFETQMQIFLVFMMGSYAFLFYVLFFFCKTNKHSATKVFVVEYTIFLLYTATYGMAHSKASDLDFTSSAFRIF